MDQSINLRIILQDPPAGVNFGLQKGQGSTYETVQVQRSNRASLQFTAAVKIKDISTKLQEPDFIGPFVQGKAPAKFMYIDIGTYAGDHASIWGRRLKIPLTGITWAMIEQVQNNLSLVIETTVPGTGKDGGPNCATVKPFNGWQVAAV